MSAERAVREMKGDGTARTVAAHGGKCDSITMCFLYEGTYYIHEARNMDNHSYHSTVNEMLWYLWTCGVEKLDLQKLGSCLISISKPSILSNINIEC